MPTVAIRKNPYTAIQYGHCNLIELGSICKRIVRVKCLFGNLNGCVNGRIGLAGWQSHVHEGDPWLKSWLVGLESHTRNTESCPSRSDPYCLVWSVMQPTHFPHVLQSLHFLPLFLQITPSHFCGQMIYA